MVASLPHKVLLVITDYNDVFYPDGKKTGLFYSEGLHPYEFFTSKGWTVDVVSEDGTYGNDEHSITKDFLSDDELKLLNDPNSPFNKALANIKKPEDINYKDYGILYAAGGHGTIFDFLKATKIHKIAEDIYENGGIVSAVCHGPLILPPLKDKNGVPLIKGRKVTGFTDEGEVAMGLDKLLKERNLPLVKGATVAVGADYQQPSSPWESFSVTDGRIVSGANPASATTVAKDALAAFEKA